MAERLSYIIPQIQTQNRIFIIADIQGCYDTLKLLIEGQLKLQKEDYIIFLGNLINKGKDSKKVLDYIIKLKRQFPNIHCVKGNHEQKLLLAFGCGFEFFEKYLADYNSEDLLDGDIYEYIDLCASMELCIQVNDYLLSHLGFNAFVRTPATDTRALFSDFDIHLDEHPMFQVHGHDSSSVAQILANINQQTTVLSIDAGCVYTEDEDLGYLCCLELNSQELFVQKNIEVLEA
ncbi:MAG: metallophosphoesterase [Saprospiraceae bacterium]|nr:metallophosphoesterase [Saprospiraceae bacterium]